MGPIFRVRVEDTSRPVQRYQVAYLVTGRDERGGDIINEIEYDLLRAIGRYEDLAARPELANASIQEILIPEEGAPFTDFGRWFDEESGLGAAMLNDIMIQLAKDYPQILRAILFQTEVDGLTGQIIDEVRTIYSKRIKEGMKFHNED